MNPVRLLAACTLCFTACPSALLAQALELSGILVSGSTENSAIVLSDREAKQTSPWLKVGGDWRGYQVIKIDPTGETAVLRQNGVEFVLSLRASRVAESKPTTAAPPEHTLTLLKGTSSVNDGVVTYSTDAVLKFGGSIITADEGVMKFDGSTLSGDLFVETERGTLTAKNASMTISKGSPVIMGKSVQMVLRSRSATPTETRANPD